MEERGGRAGRWRSLGWPGLFVLCLAGADAPPVPPAPGTIPSAGASAAGPSSANLPAVGDPTFGPEAILSFMHRRYPEMLASTVRTLLLEEILPGEILALGLSLPEEELSREAAEMQRTWENHCRTQYQCSLDAMASRWGWEPAQFRATLAEQCRNKMSLRFAARAWSFARGRTLVLHAWGDDLAPLAKAHEKIKEGADFMKLLDEEKGVTAEKRWVTDQGERTSPWERQALALAAGQVASPFVVAGSAHLVQCIRSLPALKPGERAVAEAIKKSLEEEPLSPEEMAGWEEGIWQKYRIRNPYARTPAASPTASGKQ